MRGERASVGGGVGLRVLWPPAQAIAFLRIRAAALAHAQTGLVVCAGPPLSSGTRLSLSGHRGGEGCPDMPSHVASRARPLSMRDSLLTSPLPVQSVSVKPLASPVRLELRGACDGSRVKAGSRTPDRAHPLTLSPAPPSSQASPLPARRRRRYDSTASPPKSRCTPLALARRPTARDPS